MKRGFAGHPSALSDGDLMRRVQADDIQAFEHLHDRYAATARGIASMICHSSERAEEAVQDAFLGAWGSRASYDEAHGELRTWLLTLVRNRSIDINRRNRRGDVLRASDAHLHRIAALDSVEDEAVQRDQGNGLRASLRQLPPLQREAIVLAYFGGLTHTEIAERLDVSLGTVKGRIRLGVCKARAEIVFREAMAAPGPRPRG